MDAPEIIANIDRLADEFSQTIGFALATLAGAFEYAYEQSPGPRGLRAFRLQAHSIVEAQRVPIGYALANAQSELLSGTPIANVVSVANEQLDAQGLREAALDTIESVLHQVVAVYLRQFRHFLISRAPLRSQLGEGIRATYRNGRTVRATEAMYLIARQALLDTYNQAQVVNLRNAGHSTALLAHADASHESHDFRFALVAGLDLPDYADLVDLGHLHPRAGAIVRAG